MKRCGERWTTYPGGSLSAARYRCIAPFGGLARVLPGTLATLLSGVLLAVLLAGCAGPGGALPAGAVSPPPAPATPNAGGAGATSVPPSAATPPAAGRGTGAAVHALLADASRAEREGKLSTTEALLERALHIEPRNPVLWHYMARLRVRQGRFAQARTLAARSNSLASKDQTLQADNWALIAYASAQLGDQRTAQKARALARQLGGAHDDSAR